ncbi:unnamed protein product, partial [Symbiodinium sp. CCMP2592]
ALEALDDWPTTSSDLFVHAFHMTVEYRLRTLERYADSNGFDVPGPWYQDEY